MYIRMFVALVVNLFTYRIVLNTLGFEDFGIYSVVGSFVIIFSFLRTALRTASLRYLSYELGKEDPSHVQRIFSMIINCHWLLAAILGIVIEVIGYWYINAHLQVDPSRLTATNWVFQFSVLTFCIGIIQAPYEANITAYEKLNAYALVSIVETFVKLGIAYAITVSPFDRLISYSGMMCLLQAAICAFYAIYNGIEISNCKYVRTWDKSLFKELISFSGWSMYVNAADASVLQVVAILFNRFIGMVANAALGLAMQIYHVVALFFGNFSVAFTPQIIKAYASEDRNYFMQLVFTTSKVSYYLLLWLALPIALNADFLLQLWLVDVPPKISSYIVAMMIYAVFDSFQSPLCNAVYATGKIRLHQIMIGTIKFLVIPFAWLVLKNGDDGTGALVVWGIGNIICATVRTIYCHFLFGLDIKAYLQQVISPIVGVSLLVIPLPCLIVYWLGQGWIASISSTLLTVGLTLCCGYFIGLTQNEKNIIKSFIKNKTQQP